jgi:hypothetical protein
MITYQQIEDFWNSHFGHLTDPNHQNAKAQLHALLGTDTPKLEDKLTGGDMKKITQGDEDVTI